MMPPVSLPLIGGTHWACAGADASIPHIATRLAAPIIRIADSIWLRRYLKAHRPPWKERRQRRRGLIGRCCRAALDLVRASRHRLPVGPLGGLPMRDLFFTSLKRLGLE